MHLKQFVTKVDSCWQDVVSKLMDSVVAGKGKIVFSTPQKKIEYSYRNVNFWGHLFYVIIRSKKYVDFKKFSLHRYHGTSFNSLINHTLLLKSSKYSSWVAFRGRPSLSSFIIYAYDNFYRKREGGGWKMMVNIITINNYLIRSFDNPQIFTPLP